MKLSNATTKLTCMKSKAVRILAAATLAGAALTMAAPAAAAQQFAVGVHFGTSRYAPPAPPVYAPVYVEARHDGFRRHDDWVRHEELVRHGRFAHDNHIVAREFDRR